MKIMLLGGMGFVGSHLCDRLVDKHKIVILTRSFKKRQNIAHLQGKLKIEKIDVSNLEKLGKSIDRNKPNVIIHMAGETSHSKSFDNPLYDLDSNVRSTMFILEKLRMMRKHCRFILASTFVVTGKPDVLPVLESQNCDPLTIYGANRLSSERLCKIYQKVHGLDVVIFRITQAFGPREQVIPNKNAVNYMIYRAFQKQDVTVYDGGRFYRDVIYISDVVDALELIIYKGESGKTYWIASGRKLWFYNLAHTLHEITKARVTYMDPPRYTKIVDVGNYLVDNSGLVSLGWKPKTSFRNGVLKTIKYFETLAN